MNHICVNGKIIKENEPALFADNRGYRYGDGLFETIRVRNETIPLDQFHFERLLSSLDLLGFDLPAHFTKDKLEDEILALCKKNNAEKDGRVRFSVSRGQGGLYDGSTSLQYIIEAWPLGAGSAGFNENGLVIDIFPDARKTVDKFSHVKSSSAQLYSLAAIYARTHQFNDCLILNSSGAIADSTIANLFLVKNDLIFTPALTEGCIAGVMRSYLIQKMRDAGFSIEETKIHPDGLPEADELFLSNAVKGIRWVKQFRDKNYSNKLSAEIYRLFIQTIFE